jgi:Uncharacterized conserved protein
MIDFGKEAEVDERSLLNELLDFVSTEVKELGSEREMAHIERIIREGTGADRQLAAWERTQDMKAVVDQSSGDVRRFIIASVTPTETSASLQTRWAFTAPCNPQKSSGKRGYRVALRNKTARACGPTIH